MPDIVVVKKKEKECLIIVIAIPEDNRLKQKEDEKVEKYNELERELKKIWPLKEAEVIPVINWCFRCSYEDFERTKNRLELKTSLDEFQKTALLGSARIFRKSLENYKTRYIKLLVVTSFQ